MLIGGTLCITTGLLLPPVCLCSMVSRLLLGKLKDWRPLQALNLGFPHHPDGFNRIIRWKLRSLASLIPVAAAAFLVFGGLCDGTSPIPQVLALIDFEIFVFCELAAQWERVRFVVIPVFLAPKS